MRRVIFVVLASAMCLWSPPAARGAVNVNVNVGPPPIVFPTPPRLVVVPDTRVYYAPEAGINLFVYDGRYYSFHDGAWFRATSHRGPWVAVPIARVPRPVRGVPAQYYRIPPGHAKKMEHARGPHGCPPGHAKHGRC